MLALPTAHREAYGDDSDLLVGLQLTHSGRYSYRKPLIAVHDRFSIHIIVMSSRAKRSTRRIRGWTTIV